MKDFSDFFFFSVWLFIYLKKKFPFIFITWRLITLLTNLLKIFIWIPALPVFSQKTVCLIPYFHPEILSEGVEGQQLQQLTI